jgi:hypothetical protein
MMAKPVGWKKPPPARNSQFLQKRRQFLLALTRSGEMTEAHAKSAIIKDNGALKRHFLGHRTASRSCLSVVKDT